MKSFWQNEQMLFLICGMLLYSFPKSIIRISDLKFTDVLNISIFRISVGSEAIFWPQYEPLKMIIINWKF